tara:strand:- start:219 stop:518 length:300 start_codon:yes stop_codon:yes gene_type:complete
MKKFFLLFIYFLFLTGCVQSVAILGPAISIVKTGGIQQALLSESLNQGVKQKTGKNLSEHVMSSFDDEAKIQECETISSNTLQEIFFNNLEVGDCKKVK